VRIINILIPRALRTLLIISYKAVGDLGLTSAMPALYPLRNYESR